MKNITALILASIVAAGCSTGKNKNPYDKAPFYARYLSQDSNLDREITRTLESLQQNPASATAHNDLGALLVQKGFPKDAAREFERAIDADARFYPAWYNLALLREAMGDSAGAVRALRRTIRLKPGHAAALFQMGLVEESRGKPDAAVHFYAKAYSINRSLLDVKVNPRILDSRLTQLAILKMYPAEHARRTMFFQPAPAGYVDPPADPGPSPEASPAQIITPTAPATEPALQTPVPNPGSPPIEPTPAPSRPSASPQASPPPPPVAEGQPKPELPKKP